MKDAAHTERDYTPKEMAWDAFFGWTIGACTLLAIALGFFLSSWQAPIIVPGPYAGCPVTDAGSERYIFYCPNSDAFAKAVQEFEQKNPELRVYGIIAKPQ